MTTEKVLAHWRICEKCSKCYPYIDSLTEEEFRIKNAIDEIKIQYIDHLPAGYTFGSSHSSVDPKICGQCHDDLLADQILVEVKKQRDFKTIPDFEKALMMSAGQLPSDICWSCGDKVDVGPNFNSKNIYKCPKCLE